MKIETFTVALTTFALIQYGVSVAMTIGILALIGFIYGFCLHWLRDKEE